MKYWLQSIGIILLSCATVGFIIGLIFLIYAIFGHIWGSVVFAGLVLIISATLLKKDLELKDLDK